MTALHVQEHLKKLWAREHAILDLIYRSQRIGQKRAKSSYKMFFLELLPVLPNRFRVAGKLEGSVVEVPLNTSYRKVLDVNIALINLQKDKPDKSMTDDTTVTKTLAGDYSQKVLTLWLQLQDAANGLIDSSKSLSASTKPGFRQTLERKEGLFRKHMMGKRVNYSARTVISPDPYIGTDEIGIPDVFATRLSYAEPVTPFNFK